MKRYKIKIDQFNINNKKYRWGDGIIGLRRSCVDEDE